jgi:hypothetical protein
VTTSTGEAQAVAKYKVNDRVKVSYLDNQEGTVTIIFQRKNGMIIPGQGATIPLVSYSYKIRFDNGSDDLVDEEYLTQAVPKSEQETKKEEYDYNNPIKMTDVGFVGTKKDESGTQIIRFVWNNGNYEYRYTANKTTGGIKVTKYGSLNQLKNPLTTTGPEEIIYNTFNGSQTTDEGRFVEYSVSKWDRANLFYEPKKSEPDPEKKKETLKERVNIEQKAENYKEIRQSLDEFFTPDWTAEIMFELALKHGYNKGPMCEPSFGGGVFFDVAKKHGVSDQNIFGFEIYEPSYSAMKKKYPHAHLYNSNFEYQFIDKEIFYTKNKVEKASAFLKTDFDLIIGNPPYGKHKSPHAYYFADKLTVRYEGFFIYLGLKKLRKNGLLVFIINSLWLQNGQLYNAQKEEIAKIGELVDAYRLPNKIFADTDIATDIVIFRKK